MNQNGDRNGERNGNVITKKRAKSKVVEKKKKQGIKTSDVSSNRSDGMISNADAQTLLRENLILKEQIETLKMTVQQQQHQIIIQDQKNMIILDSLNKKYKKRKKKTKEMREVALRLYSACVHGEGPRLHMSEFRDTDDRVTRDAELADLRAKVTSLYPKGIFIRLNFLLKVPSTCIKVIMFVYVQLVITIYDIIDQVYLMFVA